MHFYYWKLLFAIPYCCNPCFRGGILPNTHEMQKKTEETNFNVSESETSQMITERISSVSWISCNAFTVGWYFSLLGKNIHFGCWIGSVWGEYSWLEKYALCFLCYQLTSSGYMKATAWNCIFIRGIWNAFSSYCGEFALNWIFHSTHSSVFQANL